MRALIIASNISARMGGEAILPYHYIRELSALGVDIHALTHARVKDEITDSPIQDAATFHFVDDASSERLLYKTGKMTPGAIQETVFNSAIGAVTLSRLANRAHQLEGELRFDIIHQPTPVSPQLPSFVNRMNAPVVIGPLNGGMDYPAAFEKEYSKGAGAAVHLARNFSRIGNQLIAGKKNAARVLVANQRTLEALPTSVSRENVEILVENGVDLDLWSPPPKCKPEIPTFVFVGRLVWWKALELLIEAFNQLEFPARLLVIGDGPERARLESLTAENSTGSPIEFLGFRPQAEIRDILAGATALVLPSMRECGGAVILEAFACRIPAIATDWGGPQDYITPETGYLVPPASRETFIQGLRSAMSDLAADPSHAANMGEAARMRVETLFSWRAKGARMLEIYNDTVVQSQTVSR